MPLNREQATDKAIARLIENGEEADGLLKPNLLTWVDEALQRLARRLADSDDYQELQRLRTATAVSGAVDLSQFTDMLVNTIPSVGFVRSSSGVLYKPVPRRESLSLSFPVADIGHYAIVGRTMFLKTEAGSLVGTPSMEIYASFVPTLSTSSTTDLPVRFENQLIDTLIEMAYEKQGRKPPSPLTIKAD